MLCCACARCPECGAAQREIRACAVRAVRARVIFTVKSYVQRSRVTAVRLRQWEPRHVGKRCEVMPACCDGSATVRWRRRCERKEARRECYTGRQAWLCYDPMCAWGMLCSSMCVQWCARRWWRCMCTTVMRAWGVQAEVKPDTRSFTQQV